MKSANIIAVDLDGTITFVDTLQETVVLLVKKNPFILFLLPFWLLRGIAFFKLKVAENSELDVTTLPYNQPFIDWLREQRANKKKIVLCTAANNYVAEAISVHLGLFDDIIASDVYTNLKSINKRRALEKRYGERGYDYAGNSSADIEVWAGASQSIIVNANKRLQSEVSKVASVSRVFSSENVKIFDLLNLLRLHQWLKNLLLFVPLLVSHKFDNPQNLNNIIIAFLSFSFCASSVYIINDIFDLESDRKHLIKKNRLISSGKLSIATSLVIAFFTITLSILLGTMVGTKFLIVLLLYLILTIIYSLVLKSIVLVDCFTLSAFYTFRIIAGGVAISLSLSFWLLLFSVFIFLSLAFLKRYSEIVLMKSDGKNILYGRGYIISDVFLLQIMGLSSGYISTLILALYISNGDNVSSLYTHPIVILLMTPLVLFWISWLWFKAARNEIHFDPIIFALRDKVSLSIAFIMVVIFLYATTGIDFPKSFLDKTNFIK